MQFSYLVEIVSTASDNHVAVNGQPHTTLPRGEASELQQDNEIADTLSSIADLIREAADARNRSLNVVIYDQRSDTWTAYEATGSAVSPSPLYPPNGVMPGPPPLEGVARFTPPGHAPTPVETPPTHRPSYVTADDVVGSPADDAVAAQQAAAEAVARANAPSRATSRHSRTSPHTPPPARPAQKQPVAREAPAAAAPRGGARRPAKGDAAPSQKGRGKPAAAKGKKKGRKENGKTRPAGKPPTMQQRWAGASTGQRIGVVMLALVVAFFGWIFLRPSSGEYNAVCVDLRTETRTLDPEVCDGTVAFYKWYFYQGSADEAPPVNTNYQSVAGTFTDPGDSASITYLRDAPELTGDEVAPGPRPDDSTPTVEAPADDADADDSSSEEDE